MELHTLQHEPDMMATRNVAFPALILAVLVLGMPYTHFVSQSQGRRSQLIRTDRRGDCCPTRSHILLAAAFLHGLLQFLPWLAYGAGYVDLQGGLLWEFHLCYAISLVLAMPLLSLMTSANVRDHGKVPVLSCLGTGGWPYLLYAYIATMVQAFDQYSDSATAVLALSRGWYLAVPLAATFWMSYFLQLLVSILVEQSRSWHGRGRSALMFIVGVNPEIMTAVVYYHNTGGEIDQLTMASTGMALTMAKFFTENVPQSVYAVLLTQELTGVVQKITYVSLVLSFVMSMKGAAKGFLWFFPGVDPTTRKLSQVAPAKEADPVDAESGLSRG